VPGAGRARRSSQAFGKLSLSTRGALCIDETWPVDSERTRRLSTDRVQLRERGAHLVHQLGTVMGADSLPGFGERASGQVGHHDVQPLAALTSGDQVWRRNRMVCAGRPWLAPSANGFALELQRPAQT